MADKVDDAIAAAGEPDRALVNMVRVPVNLGSGRPAALDVPFDATDGELADLAAFLLGPVRAHVTANRAGLAPRLIVPSRLVDS